MTLVLLAGLSAGILQDAHGNVLPNRQVNVYARGTSTPVQVYSDAAGSSPVTQPLTTDTSGQVPGYVAGGASIDIVDVTSGARDQAEPVLANTVAQVPLNPKWPQYGALGNNANDDTAAIAGALTAGSGNIYLPAGTFIVNDLEFTADMQGIFGAGQGVTILKAKAGASQVVGMNGVRRCGLRDLTIDGNSGASDGLYLAATAGATVQQAWAEHVTFQNCSNGVRIANVGVTQADKTTLHHCFWTNNAVGLSMETSNSQETLLINPSVGLAATQIGISMTAGSLKIIGGQCQGVGLTFLKMTGGSIGWVSISDFIEEGAATTIDGAGWPTNGMILEHVTLQGATSCINMGVATAGTGGAKLIARMCRFNGNQTITSTGAAGANIVFLESCRRAAVYNNPSFAGNLVLTPGEDPRQVAAAGQPAFNADFGNFGSGFQPLQFWMDRSGIVHIQGTVKSTAGQIAGTSIVTLPAGYRPPTSKQSLGSAWVGTTAARTAVATAGDVSISAAATAGSDVTVSHSFWPAFAEALT